MNAKLKNIQSLISDNQFDEACKECEILSTTKEGSDNFLIWQTLGTLYVSLATTNKAISALQRAIEIDPTKPPIIKQLADLYDQQGSFQNHAITLSKLYEIVKAKGNIEKLVELSILIHASFTKAKTHDKAYSFLSMHLLHVGIQIEPSMLLKQLTELVNTKILMNKQAPSSIGLSASTSALPSSAGSNANTKKQENVWHGFVPIVQRLLREYPDSALDPQGACELIIQSCVDDWNASSICDITEAALQEIKILALAHKNLQNGTKVPDLSCYLMQTWICSSLQSAEAVSIANAVVTTFSPSSDTPHSSCMALAHAVIALHLIERGEIKDSQPHVRECIQHWLAEKKAAKPILSFTAAASKNLSILCSILVGQAFLDFRTLSIHDTLHIAQESVRLADMCPNLRSGWYELIHAARIKALIAVSPHSDILTDALSVFPHLLSVSEFWTHLSVLPSIDSVAWLMIMTLTDLRMFETAEALAQNAITACSNCSWAESELANVRLLRAIETAYANAADEGKCQPVTLRTERNIHLPAEECAPLIAILQQSLRRNDAISASVEPKSLFRLGLAQWLCGDTQTAVSQFLASARADPTQGAAYSFLGNHYARIEGGGEKAKKCYLKALSASALDAEAGLSLSALYLEQEDIAAAQKLWNDVISLTPHAHWVFALRGHFFLRNDELEAAMSDLQQALEIRPDDASCLYSLGSAYLRSGQFMSAHKTFQRALLHAPKDFYVLSSLADTARKLCLLPASLNFCERALSLVPLDVVTLKTFGEICLSLAYQHYSCGWVEGAARIIRRGIAALSAIQASCDDQPSFESLHKLNGDLHSFSRFLGPCRSGGYDAWMQGYGEAASLLQLAEASYNRVLSIRIAKNEAVDKHALANAHFDVGCSIYYQLVIALQAAGQSAGLTMIESQLSPAMREVRGRAMDSFATAIRLDPTHSSAWVGLGLVVPYDEPMKRQMALSRAAAIDANHSAYANLGMLYIHHHKRKSAEACFNAVQVAESNPLVWVGLGRLFEGTLFNDATPGALESASDAYEASLEIAKPAEGILGAVTTYLSRNCGINMLGSSVPWLQVPPVILPSDAIPSRSQPADKNGLSMECCSLHNTLISLHRVRTRHFVGARISRYLKRQPVHPLGWCIYAWSNEVQQDVVHYLTAIEACRNGLSACELIALSVKQGYSYSLTGSEGALDTQSMRALAAGLLVILNRCQQKHRMCLELGLGDAENSFCVDSDDRTKSGQNESLYPNLCAVLSIASEDELIIPGSQDNTWMLGIYPSSSTTILALAALCGGERSNQAVPIILETSMRQCANTSDLTAVLRAAQLISSSRIDAYSFAAWEVGRQATENVYADEVFKKHQDCLVFCCEALGRHCQRSAPSNMLTCLVEKAVRWYPKDAVVLLQAAWFGRVLGDNVLDALLQSATTSLDTADDGIVPETDRRLDGISALSELHCWWWFSLSEQLARAMQLKAEAYAVDGEKWLRKAHRLSGTCFLGED